MKASLLLLSLPALVAAAEVTQAISFSHEDLGYAEQPYVLRTENRLENMFRALRFCDETKDFPEAARYRFQQEVAEPLPFFLAACTPAERERFAGYLREGRIAVAATHTTVLTDRLTPESAARLFYLSGRHMPDMLGVPAPKVGMVDDVTGLSWSLPIYCEAAQVPWIFHGHNGCGRCDELEAAPLVRWTGVGGTGSVVVHSGTYNPYHNPDPAKLFPFFAKKNTKENLPLFLYGWDFAITDRKLPDAALKWNAAHPDATVRVATFEDWFPAQAARRAPVEAPVKTGPCQWMDQPVTDAWLFGRVRQAAERLPAAEAWNAVALALAPEQGRAYPWFDFTAGWHALLSNFEHTYGAACWRCASEPGWVHYETEQAENRETGLLAESVSRRTLDDALASLAARIASPHANAFAVFNPLARPRTEPVTLAAPAALAGKSLVVVDDATGARLACQWIDAATLAFTASDLPALGYRSYHFAEAGPADAPAATPVPANAAAPVENSFYKIGLDPVTGCVVSLVDKELGRELVKRDPAQPFNRYLRLHIEQPKKRDFLTSAPPSDATITVERGPVADILRVRAKMENTAGIEHVVTLWRGVKRVDFALSFDKLPSGRTLADYAENNLRGKEAVFVSLPFDIPGFKAVYETGGGGVAEPVRDQFSGTGTAFYGVQHFADLANADFGVTVSPVDFSLVEFGPARADAVSRVLPGSEKNYEQSKDYPKDSTLQLFLLNNMFSTNVRIDQPGRHAFHWALRSHAGDWRKGGAALFGESVNRPVSVRLIPPGGSGLPAGVLSFASVDAPNVTVTTLKPAEWNGDGFILRLVETEGRATTATIRVPLLGALAGVEETSLTENNLGKAPLAVTAGAFSVTLPPYGVKTLRLRGVAPAPGAVTGVTATPRSDREAELAWTPAPGAAFYRVYRGETADFTPTPLQLVAAVAGPRCLDKAKDRGPSWPDNRPAPGSTGYWRIEAVSRDNRRGPLSSVVSATMRGTPAAPGPVEDLQAIPVTPLAPLNCINLLWRANIDPGVVAYEIHRSIEPGFTPSAATLLAKAPVQTSRKATHFRGYDHQVFLDRTTSPATTYRYKIRAVTDTGIAGEFSAEAEASTRKDTPPGKAAKPAGPAHMGNDAAP